MSFEEQEIVCLNECTYDYETGYCLSCGRPPLAVPDEIPLSGAESLLEKMLKDPTFCVEKP